MHVKCSVYIATSVDGYIAAADGGIEWLHRPEYATTEMAGLGYDEFMADVDALVMGRHSFEKVLTFGEWPYEGTAVIVLTSRELTLPAHLQGKVQVSGGAPADVVAELAAAGKTHLYIDGGVTIQRFLRAGLIHALTITRIPILLGSGIPLFGGEEIEQRLRLVETAVSANGFVQVRYEVM